MYYRVDRGEEPPSSLFGGEVKILGNFISNTPKYCMRNMRGDAQERLGRGLSANAMLLAIALLLPIASMQMGNEHSPVSYTHLTLPTT